MLMACEEIMRRPVVTVREIDDVGLASALLLHHGFRHLPVVRDGKLVGLVTAGDLVRTGAGLGVDPTVAEVMVRAVKTVRPRTPVRHAARMMAAERLSCLPVVDEELTLLGLITQTDLLGLAAELAEELDREDVELCRG